MQYEWKTRNKNIEPIFKSVCDATESMLEAVVTALDAKKESE